MGTTSSGARLAKPDRRKHRRYDLHYPVQVIYCVGDTVVHLNAMSKNVSVDGMLLETPSAIPILSSVSFMITLVGGALSRSIELAGEAKVVRVECRGTETAWTSAVQYTRPIAQIEEYGPVTG